MTILVGIRCRDGVVIGADSSVTFGADPFTRTIEQFTDKKIEIIGDQVIVAGTGFVGHQQRFCSVVNSIFSANDTFGKKSSLDIARKLAGSAISDFASTHSPTKQYAALVAYRSSNDNFNLCEFSVDGFQPEMKEPNGLWWASLGSGQTIVDPFLALLAKVFWTDGGPSLRGGIFTAYWALEHACELNTGGIQKPIRLATLQAVSKPAGGVRARMLTDDELAEHVDMIAEATKRLQSFRDVLEGAVEAKEIPQPDTKDKSETNAPGPSPKSDAVGKTGGTGLPGLPGGPSLKS
jgi:hypothetical protein